MFLPYFIDIDMKAQFLVNESTNIQYLQLSTVSTFYLSTVVWGGGGGSEKWCISGVSNNVVTVVFSTAQMLFGFYNEVNMKSIESSVLYVLCIFYF